MHRELAVPFAEIGQKLRAYRMESGLRAEEIAARLGVSRAALYRYEKGDVIKIETITRLSELLGIPLLRLLGIDYTFHPAPAQFAEHAARIEEEADQIIFVGGGFCPLLLLPDTERQIARAWAEQAVATGGALAADALNERTLAQLRQRLRQYQQRRPPITAILEECAVAALLRTGVGGGADRSPSARAAAQAEVANLAALAEALPIGVQVGVLGAQALTSPFQLIRTKERVHVCTSPFRADTPPGLALGVAMVASAEETVAAHLRIAEQAWNAASKGKEAAERLRGLIAEAG
jgi:transcriptional regulator with XRE-family HTH domain